MIALLVIDFCIGSIVYCLIQLPSRNRSLLGKALQCCWATVGSTKSAWNLISKRKAAGLVSADPEAHKRQVSTKSSADRQLIYLYSSPAPNYGNEPYFFCRDHQPNTAVSGRTRPLDRLKFESWSLFSGTSLTRSVWPVILSGFCLLYLLSASRYLAWAHG